MINILMNKYYTLQEVATILKVAYITVYRWVRAGRLLAVKAGKQYRVDQEALDKFLAGRQ